MTDIAPFSLPGRFWRGNIHTHSTLSDGALAPEKVIEAYQRAGYDFLQLSEHFLSVYGWPIADTRKFRSNRFTTLIGAELHALQTSAGELWHIVAAGLPLDFDPASSDETGPELAARAASNGAFVSLAHPAWSQLTLADADTITCAHSVEIFNTGCCVETDRGDGSYLLDQMLNQGRRVSANATDDAHFMNGDHDAFGGWIQVKSQSLDPEDILRAMKAGHFYSSQGPEIHQLSITGSELIIECSPVNSIAVTGGNSRTVQRIGQHITSATLNLEKLTESWVKVSTSPWLRITCIDAAGRRAWTNPVWLDEI